MYPDPNFMKNMNPQMMKQISEAIQKLPRGKLNQLQAIMQKAMSGQDVTQEAQEFEKSLPEDFQQLMKTWATAMGGLGAMGGAPAPAAPAPSSEEMSLEQAKALVAQAAAEGKIDQEEAQGLLSGAPSTSESRFGKLFKGFGGKKSTP